ncbi:uncharacterized protein TrAFT101_008999 [Trichoderma asperellum]|uniref:uncharacterized protein n=1 Tax=Trichoderma asperellum TaxID=101201 RepID=UPI00331CDD81|nr:hypothetical protein TrAFT101_008999 [Trichoderma asperellum]
MAPKPAGQRTDGGPVIRIPGRPAQYSLLQVQAFKAGNEGRYDIQVTSMMIPIGRVSGRQAWEEKLLRACGQNGRSLHLGPLPISGFEKHSTSNKKEGVEARAEEWVCEVEPCQYRSGSQGDYQHRWWWPKRRNVRRGGSSREQALSTYAILTCATVGRFAQMPISSLSRADRMPPPQDAYTVSLPAPSPPQSISSYSRFIHDHTKRQMQAFGALSSSSSSTSSRSSVGGTSMTNGAAPPI